MTNMKLCKTKAGKGFKIVVDDQWFYTYKFEIYRLLKDEVTVYDFRIIKKRDTR